MRETSVWHPWPTQDEQFEIDTASGHIPVHHQSMVRHAVGAPDIFQQDCGVSQLSTPHSLFGLTPATQHQPSACTVNTALVCTYVLDTTTVTIAICFISAIFGDQVRPCPGPAAFANQRNGKAYLASPVAYLPRTEQNRHMAHSSSVRKHLSAIRPNASCRRIVAVALRPQHSCRYNRANPTVPASTIIPMLPLAPASPSS